MCPVTGWYISVFLPSAFQIWHESKGFLRLPDEKQSGKKCGSLNVVRVLWSGKHTFRLVDLLYQLLGFQTSGTPVPQDDVGCFSACVRVSNTLQALLWKFVGQSCSSPHLPFLSQTTNKIAPFSFAAGPPKLSKGPSAPPQGPPCSAPLGSFKDLSISGLVEISIKARPRRDH